MTVLEFIRLCAATDGANARQISARSGTSLFIKQISEFALPPAAAQKIGEESVS
jgi:hypothetical protein